MIRKLSVAGVVLVLILTLHVGSSAQQSPGSGNGYATHQDGSVPLCQGNGPGRVHRGHGRDGSGCDAGAGECQLDLAARQTLTGTVTAVNMGVGQGFPNFTLEGDGEAVTIVTSPFRILLSQDFRVLVGDTMSIVAFPSTRKAGFFVAAELSNQSTGKSLQLRDAQGAPVNVGTAARGGACRCGNCGIQ